jgi:hypothetical protein
MKNFNGPNIALVATIAALAASFPITASAAGTTSVTAADGLGGLVYSAAQDIANPVGLLIIALAYLVGFWGMASGLMSLVKASNGDHHRLAEGLLKIIGSAFLCALPDTCGVGLATFMSDGFYGGNLTTAFANHAVMDCTVSTGAAGITCMAKNIGMNLVPVFTEACFVLMYVCGVTIVCTQIYKAMMSANERGGRGIPEGFVTKLSIGFLICNVPSLIERLETTLGYGSPMITATGAQGLGQSTPPSLLAYTYSGTNGLGILSTYQELLGWCFTILVMFGIIAICRGLLQLKDLTDGKRGEGYGGAFTSIIFGCLLANGKASTCLIMTTMLGNGLGFC